MFPLDDRRAVDAAGFGGPLLRQGIRPARGGMGEGRDHAAGDVEQGGRGRPAAGQRAGGIWRRRRHFRPRERHPLRTGPGQCPQPRQCRAQRHRRPLYPGLWLGGAETPLAAQDGDRRTGRRHRHDRAGHRLRPPGRAHDRADDRQPVCRQRPENLHHQRPARRSGHRRRQDRPGGEGARRLADRRRNRRGRGLQPRPQPGEARPQGAGHVGDCSSTTSRCRPPTCSARRKARASSSS